MLEFIVLGQVPGTDIQLSFLSVVLLWFMAIVAFLTAVHIPKYRQVIQSEFRLLLIYLTLLLNR